jgi:ribonuclease P protein component
LESEKLPENQSGSKHPPKLKVTVLRKRQDFLALRHAPKTGAPAFLLAGRKSDGAGDGARVGLTVTKKLGGAVARNRIRRRLRAAAREVFPNYAEAGKDYVLIARSAAYSRNYAAILDDMKRGLLRLAKDHK